MGRKYLEDTTNVYRQKVTRKGYRPPSRYSVNDVGNEYETVEFYGPYLTRNVGSDPWIHGTDRSMTVEVQKLECFIDRIVHEDGASMTPYLQWVTEKKKIVSNEEED